MLFITVIEDGFYRHIRQMNLLSPPLRLPPLSLPRRPGVSVKQSSCQVSGKNPPRFLRNLDRRRREATGPPKSFLLADPRGKTVNYRPLLTIDDCSTLI